MQSNINADRIHYINNQILRMAAPIAYSVADAAPSTTADLFNVDRLVVWSGASDATIYECAAVNWAFRAWHDTLHLATRIPFTIDGEIELARIQASKCDSTLMQELIYCEIAGQVQELEKTGQFVEDQKTFTVEHMRHLRLFK